MITFDLEKALAGVPVLLKNSKKGFIKYKLPDNITNEYKYCGYWLGNNFAFTGEWNIEGTEFLYPDRNIIGMWEENQTTTIPEPLKDKPSKNEKYYVIRGGYVCEYLWFDDEVNNSYLHNGQAFATIEDALVVARAMEEARR